MAFMAYDAENLYFAFKCYDREPDKIKASVANRDTIRLRRLHLHQPRQLQRPAVPLRLLRQPARHPDRQPLRQQHRGLQRRLRLVERRPARSRRLYGRAGRALQEHPLRREGAGRDVHLLRAPHRPPLGAQLLPGPRSGPGLLLPDPDDAARAGGHPEVHPARGPAGLHLQRRGRTGRRGARRRARGPRRPSDREGRPHLPAHPRRDRQSRLQPGRGRRRAGRRQPPLRSLLPGEAAVLPGGQRDVQPGRRRAPARSRPRSTPGRSSIRSSASSCPGRSGRRTRWPPSWPSTSRRRAIPSTSPGTTVRRASPSSATSGRSAATATSARSTRAASTAAGPTRSPVPTVSCG
ncbi:MAG: hypothetical protein MZV64_63990 [Ignavibacteriales bacterium]|nr:hypothetical protein [Ignavibacteriales bacterium]